MTNCFSAKIDGYQSEASFRTGWSGKEGALLSGYKISSTHLAKQLTTEGVSCLAKLPMEAWVKDGKKIYDCVSMEIVNNQILLSPDEDKKHDYFFVEGERGRGHNSYHELVVPGGVELLAHSSRQWHQRGWCNYVPIVLFRVQKGVSKIVCSQGCALQAENIHFPDKVVEFSRDDEDGVWGMRIISYNQFAANNGDWTGMWFGYDIPKPGSWHGRKNFTLMGAEEPTGEDREKLPFPVHFE